MYGEGNQHLNMTLNSKYQRGGLVVTLLAAALGDPISNPGSR